MYKQLLILCTLCAMISPAHAYKVTTFKPLPPLYPVPMQGASQTGIHGIPQAYESYPKITQVENILFNRNYATQDIYSRLNRIEKKLYRRSFANMSLAERMDNILSNVDQGQMYGINSHDLAKIETKIIGQAFNNEDTESRITRLEKEMLGAMQAGNLRQRYEVIKSASKHYNAYPMADNRGTRSVYIPNNSYKNNGMYRPSLVDRVLGTLLGGYGTGALTGYTPSLYDSYSPYPTNGYGLQDYYGGNNGGYYNNRNIGTGSSIRILD